MHLAAVPNRNFLLGALDQGPREQGSKGAGSKGARGAREQGAREMDWSMGAGEQGSDDIYSEC